MAILQNAVGQLTLEVFFATDPIRLWTGEGNLTLATKTYIPGKLVDIGETQIAVNEPKNFPYFSMVLTLEGDKNKFFENDPGPLRSLIQFVWRASGSSVWQVATSVEGRLSDVEYTPRDATLTVSLEPQIYDVPTGEVLKWDHPSQQLRDSTDVGMEYVGKLNQPIPWPP